jgi:isoleucyl-tRNA synthetase
MSNPRIQQPYPDVPQQPDFPAIERRVLESWRSEGTFERSVEGRPAGEAGENEFVFYDGPPFANGLPHFGHLLTGFVKDLVPRYQTLRGRRVERRFGWDCHGLPAEMEAEKELGVSGRAAIQQFGIGNFNAHCRESVLRYTDEWHRYVTRSARWVDFANDYKTMDRNYMESVLWAFKRLWEKGLLYEGQRVLPYSWAAETPLSNFETRLDNSYREREDPAITVRFALRPEGDDRPADVLAWTTTPWTLPSNLALAVGPEIDYAIFELSGRRLILGAACAEEYAAELGDAERVGTVRGSELVGRQYQPLFPFFENTENAFRVLAAPFVDVEEGTGVVHLAPGFGEEDMEVCEAEAIPVVCPVDDEGKFTAEVPTYQGMQVIEANRPIIRELRERGLIFRQKSHFHNYPHCWRTDTPLIYRAVNSWYVRVTEFRDRMVELNQNINWVPGHIKDGLFGNWIENARDWSISRNRFWGAPIPVWKSDDLRKRRRARKGFRGASRGSAPSRHRRAGTSQPRRSQRQERDATHPGRARLLVRVRLDALRPGPLSLREPGVVREPLPGGLHRRVRGADPRLVLYDAGAGDGALRPPSLQELHLPRRRGGQGRPEALQAAQELSGSGGGLREPGRRCISLVPDGFAAAQGKRPAR